MFRIYIFIFYLYSAFMAHANVIIRDAEIEHHLNDIFKPIAQAAYHSKPHFSYKDINLYIIADSSVNAFVAGGTNIFIHTGLIQNLSSSEQLAGVLAHELGHITGGHLIRSRDAAYQATLQAILTSALIGAAAISAGGDPGQAIVGGLSAGQQAGFGNIVQFTRTQESAADQAAGTFLTRSKIGIKGLLDVMRFFSRNEYRAQDYMRSHPLSKDRITLLENLYQHQTTDTIKSFFNNNAYQRIKAKLDGFINPPETVLDKYQLHNVKDVQVIALSSAYHKSGQGVKALMMLKNYLEKQPQDIFMYDLAGQIAYENGFIQQSISYYTKAYNYYKYPLIGFALAQSLLVKQSDIMTHQAVDILKDSLNKEPHAPFGYKLLARAYGLLKNKLEQDIAITHYFHLKGDSQKAAQYARKTLKNHKLSYSQRLKMNDIIIFSQQK